MQYFLESHQKSYKKMKLYAFPNKYGQGIELHVPYAVVRVIIVVNTNFIEVTLYFIEIVTLIKQINTHLRYYGKCLQNFHFGFTHISTMCVSTESSVLFEFCENKYHRHIIGRDSSPRPLHFQSSVKPKYRPAILPGQLYRQFDSSTSNKQCFE